MIVVMGASGRVGGAALAAVVGAGREVRAVVRSVPAERRRDVEWVEADASDAAALAGAFAGAAAVFVLNPVSPRAEDVHAEADRLSVSIADALSRASVPHAVALSSQGAHLADGTGVVTTLHRFEAALRRTEVELTILRPAYFMESWVPAARHALETGAFPAFLSPASRGIDTVSTRDVGMFAARCLNDPKPGVVNLVGPARYSDVDAAETLAELHGRPFGLVPVPSDHIAAALEAGGLSGSLSAETAALYHAINGPGIPFEAGTGRYAVGRVTLRDVLGDVRTP